MIASLRGKVIDRGDMTVVLDVCGVGYRVAVPSSVSTKVRSGTEVMLLTHMVVREDSMSLYGFSSPQDLHVFAAMLSVSGIGPKIALAVVSALGSEGVRRAVVTGDLAALTQAPGLGKRGAQKLVLELRERLGLPGEVGSSGAVAEARDALAALGYSQSEVLHVLGSADPDQPVEDIIKTALKELARA